MKTELKVGIFVLFGMGILGFFSTRVSDGLGAAATGKILRARFSSAAGLIPNAEVRAAGVRVGRVKNIRLERGRALVELQLVEGIVLPRDSKAIVSSLGLLGEKYVEILPGDPDAEGFSDGDSIKAAPPQSLDQITALATDIGADIKSVTGSVRNAVGEGEDNRVEAILISLDKFAASLQETVAANRKGIDEIVANVQASTDVLREVLSKNQKNIDASMNNVRRVTETMAKLLEQNQDNATALLVNIRDLAGVMKELVSENRGSLTQTVSNVEGVTGSLNQGVPQILFKLDSIMSKLDTFVTRNSETLTTTMNELETIVQENGQTLGDSLDNVKIASARLDKTMDSLSSIMEKVDEGQGTVGKLINRDDVHDNLNGALTSLQETLSGFRKFRTILRMRGEGHLKGRGGMGYIGVDLEPSPNKFYRVELLASPFGDERFNTTETRITIGDGPETVIRTEQDVALDQILITAAFGVRHKNLSIYAGMLEYRGGLGLQYQFMNKRAWLSFEAFDFGNPVSPHLKFTGNFYVTKHIFLTAGWDNPLYQERSTPIIGGGFFIEDKDIKNLLGLAASASP